MNLLLKVTQRTWSIGSRSGRGRRGGSSGGSGSRSGGRGRRGITCLLNIRWNKRGHKTWEGKVKGEGLGRGGKGEGGGVGKGREGEGKVGEEK